MKMFEEIIKDLDFLSGIPKNGKPNFSDKSYILTNEWFSTIRRRIKYERGEKGVIYVNNILKQIEINISNLDIKSLKKIKTSLWNAKKGVENLIETYRNDNQKEVSDEYQKILTKMEILLNKLNFNSFFHTPKINLF